MPNLNRYNYKGCCLTCLLKLDVDKRFYGNKSSKHKSKSIDLSLQTELVELLAKCIDERFLQEHYRQDFPRKICQSCYRKLKSFDEFCKRARYCYEKLLEVLGSQEIAFDEVENQLGNAMHDEQEAMLLESKVAAIVLDSHNGNQIDPFNNLNLAIDTDKSAEVPDTVATQLDEAHEKRSVDSSSDSTSLSPKTRPSMRKNHSRRCKQKHRQDSISTASMNNNDHRIKVAKNSFKCAQCNHSFAHKLTLDAHVRKVHEGSKRPFKCDRCEKTYAFISGLYTHIKEIHEAKIRSYACDQSNCDRVYTSFIAMQKHKRLKHTTTSSDKKYVCEQCGNTFNQSSNLKFHRRTKHPTADEAAEKEREKELYYCDICEKQFHSRYTLKYHTLQQHTVGMETCKYECKVCGRRVAKKFMLVQHMLIHSTDKLPCEHCDKQFIRKFELQAHIRAVHLKLKPFECKFCIESFASRKTLRHHEYIHTGEKPYVCEHCGQAYRQQTCLKNHRKSHENLVS